jgi:Flp pilus assembly protein CpaB
MKQKNLAMLGVAVGCGLVAAVAVAKLSAGNTRAPDSTKVLVAKKDLPVQTLLDEKELDNLLGWADMPKNLVPPDAATDIEAVKGKSLNRTLKQGNALSVTDLGTPKVLVVPEGYKAMSVRATAVAAVAGFVKPGNRVDILYTERQNATGKTRSAILLRKMLLLAVNTVNTLDEKTGAAIQQIESVTLAVNDWQGQRLTLGEEKGNLKLMLTTAGAADNTPDVKEHDIQWLSDPFDPPPVTAVVEKKADPTPPPAPLTPKLDTAVVARKTVPLNTLINADNVDEFFATVEIKQAPEGVVRHPDDLRGFYIVRSVEAGQYLYKSLTGKEVVKEEKAPPVGPVAPPPEAKVTVKAKPRFPRFEQVFQAAGTAHRVIWLEVAPNKWKRFDSEKEANEYNPDADAPKGEDKSGSGGE